MKNLGAAVLAKYPDKKNGREYIVQDDGDGPYVAFWDEEAMGDPPPRTQAEVDQMIEANRARLDEIEARRHMPGLEERVAALYEGGAKKAQVEARIEEAKRKRWQAQSTRP